MDKKELRHLIRQRKKEFTEPQLTELSIPIMQRLLRHEKIASAKTVLMYHALKDEVATQTTLDELVKQGKTVLLPKVVDDCNMVICSYNSPDDLQVGAYGISEPTGNIYSDYDKIDVCVVPGMSFDSKNNRLGRGKGYYDRFLKQVPRAYKIGVCFDFQKEKTIPTDIHDEQVDEVI